MTKINMSGSQVGAKALCAVTDPVTLEVLPLLATSNGDGTAKLKIDTSVTVDSIDIGDVDILEFPAGNLGQRASAASLSVTPATDVADATYIGDIKFGESIIAGENHVGSVGGHTSIVTGTLTRPADTPGAYSAKDEINSSTSVPTYITFSNVARVNGGKGILIGCIKKTNYASASSVLRLHLYNAAPTPCNDHAAFAKLWADRAKEVCYIDFTAPVAEGTGSDMAECQVLAQNIPFTCVTGKDLYGRVEVISAGAAPTSGQVYEFTLLSLVD